MGNVKADRREDGFELDGKFYRWTVTDTGKDLMLIDRFTGLPIPEFFSTIEDSFDRGRGPVLLAMIATSIRAGHPDWSVNRIERTVLNLSLGDDIVFIEADAEEQILPPADGDLSTSTRSPDESSSPAIPAEPSNSATSSETLPSSSSPGSLITSPEPVALST